MTNNADTETPVYVVCTACNPNGEYPPHEAHVQVWQTGGNWVPSCSDRVIDWWASECVASWRDRREVGAPARWIRPLDPQQLQLIDGLEGSDG